MTQTNDTSRASIEQRLRRLEDIEDIRNLRMRYHYFVVWGGTRNLYARWIN
jgi:hypothetical protein